MPVYFRVARDLCETIVAIQFSIPLKCLRGAVFISMPERVRMFACVRGEYCKEPLAVCFQKLTVDTRSVVEAFHMRLRNKLDKITVSNLVFCEEHETPLWFVRPVFFVVARAGSEEKIDADNGFNALFFTRFVELYRAVEIAVVSERERFLPVCRRRRDEFGYFGDCTLWIS